LLIIVSERSASAGGVAIGIRKYSDQKGRPWLVWKTSPTFSPARSGSERRKLLARPQTRERRLLAERRGVVPPPDWINGWLCFEGEEEKRRLAPVPEEWEVCSEEQLDRYCQMATTTFAAPARTRD
jgi:hypothetical protein